MAETTGISWCDATFNPWWGCVKVSEACRNCYAATLGARFGTEWGPRARRRFFDEKHWNEPRRWNRKAEAEGRRKRVFCASMADVFENLPPDHPDAERMDRERVRLWRLIDETPWLTWLLLTKRPENAHDPAPSCWGYDGWPANVWIGTTVENQQEADRRIPHLLCCGARVRFISAEPLLGPLNLDGLLGPYFADDDPRQREAWGHGINWVIAGGESGHGARPSHPDWFRGLRDQCGAVGVPFHFKQHGEWAPRLALSAGWSMPWRSGVPALETRLWSEAANDYSVRVGKHAAGRLLDGRTWDELPADPARASG